MYFANNLINNNKVILFTAITEYKNRIVLEVPATNHFVVSNSGILYI